MELRQLQYFVSVVDEGGFTRAAERLLVAQPGISAQIRSLEKELGEALFDRGGRSVELTAAGRAALPHARAALAAASAMGESVAELTGLVAGRLAIGMLLSSSGMGLPELLREFRRTAPAVEVTVREDDAAGLLAAVRAGELDVAWVAVSSRHADPDLAAHVLAEDPLAAVVAPEHRWARRATIGLAELCTEPLIVVPPGGGIRTVLDEACADAGLRPRVAMEANSPVLVAALAAEGLGVSVVPNSLAVSLDSVHTLRIVRPTLMSRVQVVWRRNPTSPATRAFVALLTDSTQPAGGTATTLP